MLVDVKKLKSHPDKLLFTHVDGVIENTKKLTKELSVTKLAEIAAIYHDLGKINANFQAKLDKSKKSEGYANHAYFSAFAFFCAFAERKHGRILADWLGVEKFDLPDLIALTVIIAKHHGHLLNFVPISIDSSEVRILNKDEIIRLFEYLDANIHELPIDEFSRHYMSNLSEFKSLLTNAKFRKYFLNKFDFKRKLSSDSLDFFLNTQFAFSALILADKTDAASFKIIEDAKEDLAEFSKIYPTVLNRFLDTLIPDSELNKLRTAIRQEAVHNISKHLKEGKRVFELTSPTGSGKTLMLLALASQIIEEKGDKRIVFALPFLSITEQVEGVIKDIFSGHEKYIQRIDSKSENHRFADIQKELDDNPRKEIIRELGAITFQEDVFGYPFIVTTFVRFFESLLSNHNATLLKLPHLSKCIFLLDEIQSLPPRLYTFFVAYLDKFCEKFDSYAVLSTATQPNFNLPAPPAKNADKAKVFFSDYQYPAKLLAHEKYFAHDVFNRYKIDFLQQEITLNTLKEKVLGENKSVLVILNTIDDSKDFFKKLKQDLSEDEVILLNTHFTPNDRKAKIRFAKDRLKEGERIIVVSTQLIEAGVDIDFPVLYRDFALVSSIVQSAGRCNRNGKLDFGKVVLFRFYNRGKIRSDLIYGKGDDKDILRFTKEALKKEQYKEKQLLEVQKMFFDKILSGLNFAQHTQEKYNLNLDFIDAICNCMYRDIGKFRLIDEQEFGELKRYYVPSANDDNNFETLLKLEKELQNILSQEKKDYDKIVPKKFAIKQLLNEMSGNIVQVRLKFSDHKPLEMPDDYFGLFEIDADYYSKTDGVILDNLVGII